MVKDINKNKSKIIIEIKDNISLSKALDISKKLIDTRSSEYKIYNGFEEEYIIGIREHNSNSKIEKILIKNFEK